jgi:hypothetical protein
VWKKLRPPEAASLSPTAQKTSRKRAKSFPPAKAAATTKGKSSLWPFLFGKYSGTEIKIDGEDFIIMKEEEVLGILTGAASTANTSKKEAVGARR